jgi:mitogen-activated protein kinase 1/3
MQKEDPRLLPQTSMTSTTVQHNIRVGNLLHTFNIHTRYKDLKLIGRGAYGLVVSAWDTINNQQVAIKKIENIFNDHHDINASEEIKVENIGGIHNVKAKRILREIKLLRHFQHHQNIITIYDLMVEASGSNGDTGCRRASSVIDDSINPSPLLLSKFSTVYIVSKLMESDLDQIISSPQQLSGKHLKYFLYQILCAIKHVHSANVLHRDLKPSVS